MNKKEVLNNPVFKNISEQADLLGLESYVVGGYVRDFFLGRNQKKDIDILAVGSGIELAKKVSMKLLNKPEVTIFKTYGTAMIKKDDMQIEFVGARKESYSEESRNPKVEQGSLKDDLTRRDFTINALAVGINESNYGEVVDLFDGITDLEKGILKTPLDPAQTFSDDPLRMLRAIRFASQLNFKIDDDSFQAIKENKDRLGIISKERIIDELNKIILSEKPSIGFMLLDESGILNDLIPELIALKGVEEVQGCGHKENFLHTLEVLDNVSENSTNLWLRWAALLHDIGKAVTKRFDKKIGWTFHSHEFVGSKMAKKLFKRLGLPLNEKQKFVTKMIRLSARPIALVENEVSDSAVRRLLFETGDDIEELMVLCESDITTKNQRKLEQYKNNYKIVREKLKEVEERDQVRNFQPPISGETIIEAFNISPGREIGIIKNSIKEAILNGEIKNSYEEAYNYMLRKGTEMNLKSKV